MMSYAPFWKTIEKCKVSQYALIEKHNISANTLRRMKQGKYLTLRTVEDFCKILDCTIQDIVEYIPDKET